LRVLIYGRTAAYQAREKAVGAWRNSPDLHAGDYFLRLLYENTVASARVLRP